MLSRALALPDSLGLICHPPLSWPPLPQGYAAAVVAVKQSVRASHSFGICSPFPSRHHFPDVVKRAVGFGQAARSLLLSHKVSCFVESPLHSASAGTRSPETSVATCAVERGSQQPRRRGGNRHSTDPLHSIAPAVSAILWYSVLPLHFADIPFRLNISAASR